MGIFGTSQQERIKRAQQFDLTAVRQRVMREQGWDEAKAKSVEAEYRKFWMLFILYPGENFGPRTEDIDHVWHAHILFTREYAQDCEHVLGFYLHHQPDTAAVSGASKHQRHNRTEERYHEAFEAGGLTTVLGGAAAGMAIGSMITSQPAEAQPRRREDASSSTTSTGCGGGTIDSGHGGHCSGGSHCGGGGDGGSGCGGGGCGGGCGGS